MPEGGFLLVGDGLAEPATAARGGWSVRRAGDGFSALQSIVEDETLEAVLVDVESFQPRWEALAKAIRQGRADLPLYLVCPVHMEPQVQQVSKSLGPGDYLIGPLGEADWQSLGRGGTARTEADQFGGDGMDSLGSLIERMGRGADQFAAAAARWASEALGKAVRVRVGGQEACWPSGAAMVDATVVPLSSGAQAGRDELAAPVDSEELRRLAKILSGLLVQRQRFAAFRQMAFTDYLSGIYNRRYLVHFLSQVLGRAERERSRVTLLVFDIDDFKRYNDEFGHSVGDEIIRSVARLMRQCTRPQDVVARIGGDEFAVLFWDSAPPRQPGSQHPHEAQAMADRFRKALANHSFALLGPDAQGTLTISGGLASFPWDGRTADELLSRACEGLGKAKQSGKDRIYIVGRPGG